MIPRASFVIPAYNGQKYLNDAVQSCLQQRIKQVEVIVVNDGSTDGTAELLNWLAQSDRRVIPVHLEKNVGRSAARNIGNQKAQAPFIFVLDADDMCTKNRVRDSLDLLETKRADVVWGPFFIVNEIGAVLQRVGAGPFNKEIAVRRRLNYICHSTMAYRKEVAQTVPYDQGVYSELGFDDWKFQWDCYLKGYTMEHGTVPLCYYRKTEGTISSTRDEKKVAEVKERFLAAV